MTTENKLSGMELLRALCLEFGPTGCEHNVAALIEAQLQGVCEVKRDRMDNVLAHLPGSGPRIMLSAHMDEVGMMITSIDDKGYLRFTNVGGIDTRVLCGRRVQVGTAEHRIPGVIGAKAIHLQSADDRTKSTPMNKLYIDIGADSKEEAEKYVDIGDFATFDTGFGLYGQDDRQMRGKAIDDRLGCAVMIEVLRALAEEGGERPYDLWCAFSVREEIGKSGARVAAYGIEPEFAIVLETTAVGDIPGASPATRVAEIEGGGVISLVDRSTIYDMALVNFAMECGKAENIPCQLKRYVSGGNDAGNIHKTRDGVRCLAISAPTRYLHSGNCVTATANYGHIRDLVLAMLNRWNELN